MRGVSRLGGVSVVFTIQPGAPPMYLTEEEFEQAVDRLRKQGHILTPISYLGDRVVAYAVECTHK